MIAAIEGIIESHDGDIIILKTGPFSIIVNVPGSTRNNIGKIGDSVYLFTYLHIREENISLFGFGSKAELQIFKNLIQVNGLGPKLALALLSSFDPQQLIAAILNNNTDLLSEAPGVGKKLAGRIVLELKSKLEKEGIGEFTHILSSPDSNEVVEALVNLGYSVREASEAVLNIPSIDKLSLEEKIKYSLQRLASK